MSGENVLTEAASGNMGPFLNDEALHLKQSGGAWELLLTDAETSGINPTMVVEVLHQADGGYINGLYDLSQAPYQVVARIINEAEALGGHDRTSVVRMAKQDLLLENKRRNGYEKPDRLEKMNKAMELLNYVYP